MEVVVASRVAHTVVVARIVVVAHTVAVAHEVHIAVAHLAVVAHAVVVVEDDNFLGAVDCRLPKTKTAIVSC